MTIYRSKAPLRIGLAGGGTDVSPYSDIYGGNILNATINLFAHATIIPRTDNKIYFYAHDRNQHTVCNLENELAIDGEFDLHKGAYNRIIRDFVKKPLSFELHTHVDAPAGSGLGTSSTLMVAILAAFVEWLSIPLGEYDIAHLAYEIERLDLNMAGGKQDQYSATFGGFNFMEFHKEDRVIVNPLRIKRHYIHELESSFILYYTGMSRKSAEIIDSQVRNVNQKQSSSIEAMHRVKEQAQLMKDALLRGELNKIGEILNFGWSNKKKMSTDISNALIDSIYETAILAGASGGKVSGAGGGGFMFFYCPGSARYKVLASLGQFEGTVYPFQFIEEGVVSWQND